MDMFGSAEHSCFPPDCLLTSGLHQKSNKAGLLSSFSEATGAFTVSFQVGLWDGSHNGDVTQQKQLK